MELVTGVIGKALKIVIYGSEGIGKSTFASHFPSPVFQDTEGSTKWMSVTRAPYANSWTGLLANVTYFAQNPQTLQTYVLDTTDWAEVLCIAHVCAKHQKAGIEDFGYGKGYTYVQEEFGKLLNQLEELVSRGIHVLLTAHAKMRKFEQPDEMGAYDRWELKLSKGVAPMVKEWADIVLFANYKTTVVNVDNQGAVKGKNKAQGGHRIMYTSHHPCWDAKNRHGLKEELDFDFSAIAHLFQVVPVAPPVPPIPAFVPVDAPMTELPSQWVFEGVPDALVELMQRDKILPEELQELVGEKGYFPAYMPIGEYPADFIEGWCVACWSNIVEVIEKKPNRLPF